MTLKSILYLDGFASGLAFSCAVGSVGADDYLVAGLWLLAALVNTFWFHHLWDVHRTEMKIEVLEELMKDTPHE